MTRVGCWGRPTGLRTNAVRAGFAAQSRSLSARPRDRSTVNELPRRSWMSQHRARARLSSMRPLRQSYAATVHLQTKGSSLHDSPHRSNSDRVAAAVRPGSGRRRRRPGAAGRQVRRDVDVPELHLPVVQLPQPAGRSAVLRPGREHRGRGVRPRRARREDDQHDAHRRDADDDVERPRAGQSARRASRASATRTTSSSAARARCRRTRRGGPGTATTSSPPATSSRT